MNVGELAFYLTLNDSAFTRGMEQAGQKANRLAETASRAGQAVATMFTGAAAGAAGLLVAMTKAGASYNILQQNSRAALTTLLGSQKAVNAQMEKLNDLAQRSPFSKAVFISAQQQLLSFGMAAEKVIPTLDAVQNAVAATGGSSQQLSEITFVLAQIQAAGKITGQDLMQLGQRGIDAATLIGGQMGKTGAQIRQDITNGALSAGDAIDALTKGMAAKFGGATDLIKQQWSGAADRIKAAWRDTGAIIAEPFIDPNGGGQAVVWGNLVADTMRSVQKHVQTAMAAVERDARPVFQAVTKGLQAANGAVAGFDMHALIRQVESLSKYQPLIAGVSGALVTMGVAPIPGLNKLLGGVNPLVVGLAALAATSPELREVGSTLVDALKPAAPFLNEAAKAAADLALQLIQALAPGLTEAAEGAGDFAADLAPLIPEIVHLMEAGVPLVGVLADLAGWVTNLPTPLLAAVAAIIAFHSPLGKMKDGILGIADKAQNAAAGVGLFIGQARQTGVINAASQAVGGFSTALAGLLSPANLVGLGLTVLTGIIAAYAAKKAEAKRIAADFAATLDEETGAVTENSRAWAAKKLEEEGVLNLAKDAGLSTSELTSKIVEGGKAYEEYRQSLVDAYDAIGQATGATLEEIKANERKKQALAQTIARLDELTPAMDEGRESAAQLAEAQGEVASETDRQRQAIDALIGAQQKQAAANGDLVAAQYQTKDATAALTEAIGNTIAVQRDATGGIDLMADSNRGLVEATMSKIKAINAEVDAYAKTGATQTEVNARQESLTQGLYDQLAALGIVGDEAKAFAEKLGLIPEHKATTIDMTVDSEAAEQDLDKLIGKVETADGTITINADDTEATKTLMRSLGLVETAEGVYSINAKDDPAKAKLLLSLSKVNESTGTITIDGNNQKVINAANQAKSSIDQKQGTITINGKDYATSVASQAVSKINSFQATIGVWFKPQNSVSVPYADGFHKRDGGLVDYYAGGGFSENHVAQIAPAGSWRVWAEPETGGEAYVPLAPSKRERSTEIMAEIARRFGDLYIPNAKAYADGTVAGSGSDGNPIIHVTAVVENPWTGEQVKATVRNETIKVVKEAGR